MRRAPALLLATLLSSACASGGGADRALVEAGRLRRREQPPPPAAELRLEVGSFLENELPLLEGKAARAFGREARTWRTVYVAGAALGVLAASSGTVTERNDAWKPILVGTGAASVIGGGIAYYRRTRDLRECVAYLAGARKDVASFLANGIPPGDGPATEAVWHAWVDRVAAIRGYPACARLR